MSADQLSSLVDSSVSGWDNAESILDLLTTEENSSKPFNVACRMEGGVQYLGETIGKEREGMQNVEECRQLCVKEMGCEAWVFRLEDKKGRCELLKKVFFDKVGGYKLDKRYVSGPVACNGALRGPGSIFVANPVPSTSTTTNASTSKKSTTTTTTTTKSGAACEKVKCVDCTTILSTNDAADSWIEIEGELPPYTSSAVTKKSGCCPVCVLKSSCFGLDVSPRGCAMSPSSASQWVDEQSLIQQKEKAGQQIDVSSGEDGKTVYVEALAAESAPSTTTPLPYSQSYYDQQAIAKAQTASSKQEEQKKLAAILPSTSENQDIDKIQNDAQKAAENLSAQLSSSSSSTTSTTVAPSPSSTSSVKGLSNLSSLFNGNNNGSKNSNNATATPSSAVNGNGGSTGTGNLRGASSLSLSALSSYLDNASTNNKNAILNNKKK
eukprot:GDKK01054073.1.p1 GENE.GDKK01054073.1~~GDKK01054073.1.p1  ORF type:complete len:500 (+),score=156.55 GDKK01054073.1:191-1501(+)